MPLTGFSSLVTCLRGFDSHDRYVLQQTITILGGIVREWKERKHFKDLKRVLVIAKNPKRAKRGVMDDEVLEESGVEVSKFIFKDSAWLFKVQYSGKTDL